MKVSDLMVACSSVKLNYQLSVAEEEDIIGSIYQALSCCRGVVVVGMPSTHFNQAENGRL